MKNNDFYACTSSKCGWVGQGPKWVPADSHKVWYCRRCSSEARKVKLSPSAFVGFEEGQVDIFAQIQTVLDELRTELTTLRDEAYNKHKLYSEMMYRSRLAGVDEAQRRINLLRDGNHT